MKNNFLSMRTIVDGAFIALLMLSITAYSASPASLLGARIQPTGANDVELAFRFDRPVAAPRIFTVRQESHQLVLDFAGVENRTGASSQAVSLGALDKIDIVQGGDADGQPRTRIVLGLTEQVSHALRRVDDKVILSLLRSETSVATTVDPRTPKQNRNEDDAFRARITDVAFRRGENGQGRIQVSMTDPSIEVDVNQDTENRLEILFHGARLDPSLERRLDVIDFGTPTRFIDTLATDSGTRMLIDAGADYTHITFQSGNLYTVEIAEIPEEQLAQDDEKEAVFSGEKLSLNIQDGEIRSVLGIISEFTGLNIVVRDSVSGSITVRLNDVPWDQAMEIILQSQNLAMRRTGNVILVAPAQELADQDRLALESRVQLDDLAPIQSKIIELNYADAGAMATALGLSSGGGADSGGTDDGATDSAVDDAASGVGSNPLSLLSSRGTIIVDERTNSLVVYETAERIVAIGKVIEMLDRPVRQVLIESRLVNVQNSFFEGIGGTFGLARQNNGTVSPDSLGSFGGAFGTAGGGLINDFSGLGNGAAAAGGNFGIVLGDLASQVVFAQLRALEQDSLAKTISAPKIVTANNEAAQIESGTQVPIVTQQVSGGVVTAVTELVAAVLNMTVTPRITPDDFVILQVEVTNDSPNAVSGGIDTQSLQTTVSVANGDTVVLGGVMQEVTDSEKQKTPLFGDLPIVGHLFRGEQLSTQKNELVIFITPTILTNYAQKN